MPYQKTQWNLDMEPPIDDDNLNKIEQGIYDAYNMAESSANLLGGHSVQTDVPQNAVFTDTTYSEVTTSQSGLMSATDKTKLNGISNGANKVNESSTNGNIQIDDAETVVYDDSEITQRVTNTETEIEDIQSDLSTTVVETAPSNPLTFTTRSAQKAQSAEIVLEPIQDLHGYDHPWPAGGGKNQLNLEDTVIGETSVSHVVDILVGQSVVTAVATTGWQQYRSKIQLDTGAYIASVDNVIPSDSSIKWRAVIYDETAGSGVPFAGYDLSYKMHDFNIIEGHEYSLMLRLNQVYTAPVGSKVTFTGLMIRLSTETDPTFAPYSNYCPIDGHTEVSVGGCGKNTFDKTKANVANGYIDTVTNKFVTTTNHNTIYYPIIGGLTYTVSKMLTKRFGIAVSDSIPSSDQICSNFVQDNSATNLTIQSSANDKYIWIWCRFSVQDTASLSDIEDTIQLEIASSPTAYEPFIQSNDLTKDLGMEVYGASYNPVSGELVVTWGHISEYNGETLPGEWISDRDVYEPNTSPSTGAEVAYELATPITYQLTPDEIKLLSGANTIWTDGTSIKVAYRDGKVATLADLQEISDSPFKIVNGALCWISNK